MFKKLLLISLCLVMTSCAGPRMNDDMNDDTPLNDVEAYKLGMQYMLGKSVPQDYRLAADYFEKSADMGNPYSANQLGFLYAAGKGVPQNYAAALAWYQKAANKGVANAQYNLGIMYLHGIGTPIDTIEGNKWIHEAKKHGFNPQNLPQSSS